MACLYKRGNNFWVSYRINGKLVQRSLHTDRRRVAKEKVRQIDYELSRGELQRVSRIPLRNFLEEFCKHLAASRTYKSYKNDFSRLRTVFGPVCESLKIRPPGSPLRRRGRPQADKYAGKHINAKYLEDVTAQAINRFFDERVRENNWSPKTVNNYRQMLHKMFNYAIKRHDFCSRDRRYPNPAAAVERRKESASEIRFLSMAQIDEQLEALKDRPVAQAMVATYIYAGLRREEATWLTTKDIDLESRLIRVRAKTIDGEFWQPKTKKNRVVPISDALFAILQDFRPPHQPRVWFFPSPTGRRWDPDNFSQDLRKINKARGLAWRSLDFRHTFGSQLAQKGESLYKISALMGNSPEICRKHYAALIPEKMADVVEFGTRGTQSPGEDTTERMLEKILQRLDNNKKPDPGLPRLKLVRPIASAGHHH